MDDIVAARDEILEATQGMDLPTYASHKIVRGFVERQFEVMGEAMRRLLAPEPVLSLRLHEATDVIDFRNFLAHAYHLVNHEVVWGIMRRDVPNPRAMVAQLRAERDAGGASAR
jgi:uncharacterized protein with HEPN domain